MKLSFFFVIVEDNIRICRGKTTIIKDIKNALIFIHSNSYHPHMYCMHMHILCNKQNASHLDAAK